MKERILYLDNLKVIAIFCVVYTHFILLGTGWLDHFTDVITYIGCPIFFMVNGALVLNREGFNLKNHLRKILHIYLVFGCWKFIMVFVCEVVFHEPLFPWQSAEEFLNYMAGYRTTYHPTEAFWFLAALLQIYLIVPLIKNVYDSGNDGLIKYVCILLFCVSFLPRTLSHLFEIAELQIMDFTVWDMYKPFGTYANQLLFFLLGGMFHRKYYIEGKKEPNIQRKCVLNFVVNVGLLYLIKGCTNGFCGEVYNGIPGYSMIPTLFASCSLFILLSTTKASGSGGEVRRRIAENTLCIYILHLLIGRIASSLFYSYIPYRNVVVNAIKCVVLIFISVVCGEIMKKIPVVKKLTKI